MTDEKKRIKFLEDKVRRLLGDKKLREFITPAMGLDSFPQEVQDKYYDLPLKEFVDALRKNAYEPNVAKKVGYINAIAGTIGLPTGPDNVWMMPDANWEPNVV